MPLSLACLSTSESVLPSSIQRAEDFVGMAMPTVGLLCASADPARATEPSTMADRTDLSNFMFHSQSVEPQSPRCRGLPLAPVRGGASSGTIVADGNKKDDQSCVAVLQAS